MPPLDLKIMKRGEAAQRMYDLGRTKGTTKEQVAKPPVEPVVPIKPRRGRPPKVKK